MTRLAWVFAAVFAPMAVESWYSRRNERALRSAGAAEAPGDVYRLMRAAYPACFAAMLVEGSLRGAVAGEVFAAGALVFAAGKGVKYWAMAALGPRWSFRVLVQPGLPLVASGPYRWLRHPNYAGVAGELAGVALMTGAVAAGPLALAAFGALLGARIRVENRALDRP
jgi:methyltransferase